MTGLNYSTYITQIMQMAVIDASDANFAAILPSMIDYAEQRIYRDLDLLEVSTSLTGESYKLTAGDRKLSFSKDLSSGGYFNIIEQINLIIPAGSTDPDAAMRLPLMATTKEFLDAVYGSAVLSNLGQPKYFAPFNDSLFIVGPAPLQDYYVEVVGTYRPAPLSETNTTTFISKYMPDLMIMASMVYISAYQRNFGRQADDPQMAQSYEGQYQGLLKGALVEEARKKFEAAAWTSQSPAVVASPTRG